MMWFLSPGTVPFVLGILSWTTSASLTVGRDILARNVTDASQWVDTWVSMPQLTEYTNVPPPPFNQTGLTFNNSTIRQTLHMSIGSDTIRVRFSNAFSNVDLPITAVTIASPADGKPGSSAIDSNTLQTLTFEGSPSFIIPNGALAVSDPVQFRIRPQSTLTVSIYLANGQKSNYITSHPGSRTTSYISFGDYTTAGNMTDPSTIALAHWYFVSAVETWTNRENSAFVIVGDSITDGRGSTTDGNNRWPDQLLSRLQNDSATSNIAIGNQAAGGNRVLADGLGPNALGRIERDVLSHSGVRYAMIFEGVNDIGSAGTDAATQMVIGDRLISAYKQIVRRVHTFGIPIFGATITPFSAPGYNTTLQPYSNAERERTRQRVNAWIRDSGTFDAVIDFDAAMRDPNATNQLNPLYDSGDYLHPNVAGYKAMAAAFPIDVFQTFASGVSAYE